MAASMLSYLPHMEEEIGFLMFLKIVCTHHVHNFPQHRIRFFVRPKCCVQRSNLVNATIDRNL